MEVNLFKLFKHYNLLKINYHGLYAKQIVIMLSDDIITQLSK